MEDLRLIPITRDGRVGEEIGVWPAIAEEACKSTAELYQRVGFRPPWIGYLAIYKESVVGTCAFAAPPADGTVEIAYFTFPQFEGQGIATAMAGRLIAIANETNARIQVTAHTLPEENASTAVLRKLAFNLDGPTEHPVDGRIWRWRLGPAT